ncbi:DNA cytosine methyltransferase [Yersinia enterocolitica]|uniref:MT-A70 family methyltransferase n=1 Tax=Yersinia enterocolitica TaxID=630 RepID=UPI0005DC9487|nr:MT-A70 family methyltransferase [Yersinia enterocolitica]ELI7920273.1 DNA cytosine methyltransferase [Yersinia enterocolitica]ELI8325009.1 DNA cytosine methyltransferase [Yersinia enterocolitica]CQJ10115.1 putative adenine-specific modification methylase [Yersinia enterocolitica]CQR00821.1 putative adenine-specific modification methylase [Yersinia enterocolitica]
MRYGSVCSGIEAASLAWEPLGWTPIWFSEIEPFPSAVLAHRWPTVTNLGDMTKIAELVRAGSVEAPDILVGGTPCQAFSVAGLRNGLADARGQLTLSYVELADAIDDTRRERGEKESIIVWENVPGVLSSKDNAFGCFLAALAGEDEPLVPSGKKWTNAGYVSGPKRAIAWIIKDAQYFGVAQQRRRVLLIASARNDLNPAKVLFELESYSGSVSPDLIRSKRCTTTIDGSSLYRFRRTDSYIADGLSSTLSARDYKDARDLVVTGDGRVRKLLPVEYERLNGFSDNHTLINYKGKLVTDAPRYKAIGNSMAVNVMHWLGQRIADVLPPLLYDVIYADPPWQYGSKPNRGVLLDYSTMSVAELCGMQVKSIASQNAALFMWVTGAMVSEALTVGAAWGFKFIRIDKVWEKKKHTGSRHGVVGPWGMNDAEFLLLFTRGKVCGNQTERNQYTVYEEKYTGIHSGKPHFFREQIERRFKNARRIELFARTSSPGWDVWGDQAPNAARLSLIEPEDTL